MKFYRPGRWTDAQIIEEHRFSQELADADLPVIAPLACGGATLHEYQGYRFSAYPRRGGHPVSIDNLDVLYRLGQYLGRIHAVGAIESFAHRVTLDVVRAADRRFALLTSGIHTLGSAPGPPISRRRLAGNRSKTHRRITTTDDVATPRRLSCREYPMARRQALVRRFR